jgi:hypothetical protein
MRLPKNSPPLTPYRTTPNAQRAARAIRIYDYDSDHAVTLHPVRDVLSPRALALLHALERELMQQGKTAS